MLYGRGVECAAIDRLLDGAREGTSGVLVLRGEAGVGKSALLEHAAARAADGRILRAVGVESESELPWAGLHALLRPVLPAVERLPDLQARALRGALGLEVADAERFLISAAVLNLLAEASEERPLLGLVDDAQWLDRPSADALLFAARRLEAERVALLLAARDSDERPFPAEGLPELRVNGLERGAATELITERDRGLAAHVRDRLVENAAGNPLALLELPGALTAEELSGRAPLPDPLPVGPELERAFFVRATRLPPATQRLVLLAAAEESGDAAVVLHAATDIGVDAAAAAPAQRAGLLDLSGGRVEFRHPLVRSAVYHHATLHERHAAHRALAQALAGERHADRQAWHLAAAAVGPDEEVAALLAGSAERARRRSGYGAAARALERAASLSPDDRRRADRLVAAADSAWLGAEPDRALGLLVAAEQLDPDQAQLGEIDRIRGVIELRRGDPRRAHELLLRGAARNADDVGTALRMLLLAGEAASYAGANDGIAAAGRLAAELAPRAPDEVLLARLLTGIGLVVAGDTAGGRAQITQALEIAETREEPELLLWAGAGAAYIGAYDVSPGLYDRAIATARARGALGTLPWALEFTAYVAARADDYPLARSRATEGLALAAETGQELCAAHHRAILALVAARQAREDDCRREAEGVIARADASGWVLPGASARWALGVLGLALGRPDEARGVLAQVIEPGPRRHELFALYAAPDFIEAAVRSGRRDEALQALAAYVAWAQAAGPPWAQALAHRCRALLAAGGDARGSFEAALAAHGTADAPWERARTELCFGEALRRDGERREARVHLRAALEAFERLDAGAWAERAREELRASGETARRRDPGTRDELTPQELQIATLVAEGLSNRDVAERLFISHKTVEYHLHKVYAKLGVASRLELVRQGPASLATGDAD